MNDIAKVNGKMSFAKMAGIGIVGIVLGFLGAKFLFRSLAIVVVSQDGGRGFAPARKTALITLKTDNGDHTGLCEFTDGNGIPYKFPVLKSNQGVAGRGDTVTWFVQDESPRHSGSPPFDVSFPNGTGRGTPFGTTFNFNQNRNNSGESSKSGPDAGDYSYDSVVFHTTPGDPNGDISCSNAKDPGVHIDN